MLSDKGFIRYASFLVFFFACQMAVLSQPQTVIPDSDITHAIEAELMLSKAVSTHLLDVSTDEGIVILSGQVDHILARDRAVEIAQSIKGVKSVIDRIEVQPDKRPDEELRADIRTAMKEDPVCQPLNTSVAVSEGDVTLSGSVESYAEKQVCAAAVKGVKGVRDLTNEIDIQPKAERSDATIEEEIEQLLEYNVYLEPVLIEVNVNDGRVQLSGTVGSAFEKKEAIADAWVAGVKGVDARELDVVYWARDEMERAGEHVDKSDKAIKDAIITAFAYDPRVAVSLPTVMVQDGIVTLSGMVSNMKAKIAAEKNAAHTVGVWKVNNYLKVRPDNMPSDEDLRNRVINTLERDPYINTDLIDVTVQNGKVYVDGRIAWPFERQRITELLSGVPGVVDIENQIEMKKLETRKQDWEIRDAVREQLFWNPATNAEQIDIQVEDGIVTLTGTVYSWMERKEATEEAFEGGATRVKNKLEIEEWPYHFKPY